MEELSLDEVHIDELLYQAFEAGYVELYLEAQQRPRGRSRGASELVELSQYEVLRPSIVRRLVYDVLMDAQIAQLERHGGLMFRYTSADGQMGFHVHAAIVKGQAEAVFHTAPPKR